MTKRLYGVGVMMLAGLSLAVAATPPPVLNYQGVLRSNTNAPLTGNYDMAFRLFDAASGGNELLVDSHTSGSGGQVAVSGGLFNVGIGSGAVTAGSACPGCIDISVVFRDYAAVFLEIQVNGETLNQRVPVRSAAYAMNATHLDGLPAGSFAGAVHNHDGTEVTSGKINNARLNMGAGNGLDADTLDGIDATAFVPTATNAAVANQAVRKGANLIWASSSQIRIKPGILGFTDGKVRSTTADLIWSFATGVGDLGLDAGIEATNTWYYLYAIPDPFDDDTFTVVASVGSPPATGGTGPALTTWKYLGAFFNDGAGNILDFRQNDSRFFWTIQRRIDSFGGGNQPRQSLTLAPFVPVTARELQGRGMIWQNVTGSEASEIRLYVNSSVSSFFVNIRVTHSSGNNAETAEFTMPIDGQSVDYESFTWGGQNNVTTQEVWALGWTDAFLGATGP